MGKRINEGKKHLPYMILLTLLLIFVVIYFEGFHESFIDAVGTVETISNKTIDVKESIGVHRISDILGEGKKKNKTESIEGKTVLKGRIEDGCLKGIEKVSEVIKYRDFHYVAEDSMYGRMDIDIRGGKESVKLEFPLKAGGKFLDSLYFDLNKREAFGRCERSCSEREEAELPFSYYVKNIFDYASVLDKTDYIGDMGDKYVFKKKIDEKSTDFIIDKKSCLLLEISNFEWDQRIVEVIT